MAPFDITAIRQQFPFLQQQTAPVIYLDNAATTQKPQCVIEAQTDFYVHHNANVHRATHQMAHKATDLFEAARQKVAHFIGANRSHEIIWTKGTTESINLLAYSFSQAFLRTGDEILISAMEHHANIVPWQLIAQTMGLCIKIIPVSPQGEIDQAEYQSLFTEKTHLVCLTHVSNALGSVNDIGPMIRVAHAFGAKVLIDGAQAIAHIPVDVKALDCDFYVFSGHKIYGPTGIGVLYGKEALLEAMPPYQAGGEMIEFVSFARTTFNSLPFRFEAGTPNIAGAIGLGCAIDFIQSLDRNGLQAHEHALLRKLYHALAQIPGCGILTPQASMSSLISFIVDGIHPSDLATLLDEQRIAVRSGTHCAMPIYQALGLSGSTRVSVACYTSEAEIDQFIHALYHALEILSA